MRYHEIINETVQPIVLRAVPSEEANALLHSAYFGGKNKDLTPTPFHREKENFVLVDLPLAMILPNEDADGYDLTTSMDRVRDYVKQQIDTPIFVTFSALAARRGSKLGYVADGGHRVSAARLRGDQRIRSLMRRSDFDRLMASNPNKST